jgi:hypothetical protein
MIRLFNGAGHLAIAVVIALAAPGLAFAQTTPASAPTASATAPHVPLQKTIGQKQSQQPQVFPSLIVMNSRGATMQGGKLTMIGVAQNAIVFADRPTRAAGHDLTTRLLEEWAPGNTDPGSFTKDPPNATVSVFSQEGSTIRDAVVVLKSPKLEGDRLTFDVDVLEGDITGADGPASLFIDIIGRPLTPFSYAGVARRSAYRGAMYTGAAVAGAAAVGAAAAYGAYGAYGYPPAYYRPACGYYPAPPCY